MAKSKRLSVLYNNYVEEFSGEETVLGDGNMDAKLLLIGEAPGKDEVTQGKPFVGAAGKKLTEFLDALELKRETIYITNVIKYRLSIINPNTGKKINRPAGKSDIEKNRKYLLDEILILNPKLIVTLGNVPLKALMGNYKKSIGEIHGELTEVVVNNKEYFLFPLYHPASIIYNRALKQVYMEDLVKMSELEILREK